MRLSSAASMHGRFLRRSDGGMRPVCPVERCRARTWAVIDAEDGRVVAAADRLEAAYDDEALLALARLLAATHEEAAPARW